MNNYYRVLQLTDTHLYPHDYPGGWVEQRYLPEGLERGCFYQASPRGWEAWRQEAIGRDIADAQASGNDAGAVG